MSQQDKGRYFRALKELGVNFTKHYREYTTDELAAAYARIKSERGEPTDLPPEDGVPSSPSPVDGPPPVSEAKDVPEAPPLGSEPEGYDDFKPMDSQPANDPEAAAAFWGPVVNEPPPERPEVPFQPEADPNEMPGQRLNQGEDELEPIRTDEHGRIWYQEEVQKPGYAKPRGRRVLTYNETGFEKAKTVAGDFTEEFEVAGTGPGHAAQVKITLPSFQTGIYKHPNYPFKVHTYNGVEGFDFYEVADFWHGADLVPSEVKRMYVENVLCFDIRTVVRQIEKEYRELMLAGRID